MTCYDGARACHLLTFGVAAAVTSTVRMDQSTLAVLGALASFGTMFCMIMWRAYAELTRYYEHTPDVAHPYTLTWRERHQAHRLLFLLVAIPAFAGYGILNFAKPERAAWWFALALCFWLTAMYLQCCIPKTPAAVREFRETQEQRSAELAAHAAGTRSPV